MSPDDLKTVLSVAAIVISLLSLYFTRLNWLQSNRPIVSAFVTEHASGNMASTWSLVVSSTGTRPAARVRLHAPLEDIKRLLEANVDATKLKWLEMNFRPESEIPLLRNGEELDTSFGAFTGNHPDGPWLRYGAEIEIRVTYDDLDGRRYSSRQPLKIYARKGFGGASWASHET